MILTSQRFKSNGVLLAGFAATGFFAALLALLLKHLTEHYQAVLFAQASTHLILWLLLPVLGLTAIRILRQVLFKGKANKGISEIMYRNKPSPRNLPLSKIPSHLLNGFLTVVFGGSTGIEVSTVVASAAFGSVATKQQPLLKRYRKELIAAGVAAGVTALFASPAAGLLFSWEVLYRKAGKRFFTAVLPAIAVAFALVWLLDEPSAFHVSVLQWHYHALPYLLVLAAFTAVESVYLTRIVLLFKSWFFGMTDGWLKITFGALLIGSAIWLLPALYGDGYHAVQPLLSGSKWSPSLWVLTTAVLVLLFKPLATAITLACGGDGGVFAPSLFLGAFMGFAVASCCNVFLEANVIVVNFVVIGMAASLSACIHAPFTALFLVCAMVNNYVLFVPMLAVCLLSRWFAQQLYPHTVYTYASKTMA